MAIPSPEVAAEIRAAEQAWMEAWRGRDLNTCSRTLADEFLIVSSTFARAPLLAIVLVLCLLVALGALMLRLNEMAFGTPTGKTATVRASYVPLYTHLALVLAAGIYLPAPLVAWFQSVARLLG